MATPRQKGFFVAILLPAALFSIFLIIFLSAEAQKDGPSPEICDLRDNDQDGRVDEGFRTTCSKDSDCGPSGPFGERFCRNGDSWGSFYTSTCSGEKGTCLSECSAQQQEHLVEPCTNGCENGLCVA